MWLVGLPLGVLSVGDYRPISICSEDIRVWIKRLHREDQRRPHLSVHPIFKARPVFDTRPYVWQRVFHFRDRDMAVFDLGSIQSASTPPDSIVLDEPGFGPSPVSFGESSGSSSHPRNRTRQSSGRKLWGGRSRPARFVHRSADAGDPALPFAIVPSASTGCAVRRLSDGCCVLMAYRMSLSPASRFWSAAVDVSTSMVAFSRPSCPLSRRLGDEPALASRFRGVLFGWQNRNRSSRNVLTTAQKSCSNLSKPIGANAEARHSGSPVVIPLADRAPHRPAEHPLGQPYPLVRRHQRKRRIQTSAKNLRNC